MRGTLCLEFHFYIVNNQDIGFHQACIQHYQQHAVVRKKAIKHIFPVLQMFI